MHSFDVNYNMIGELELYTIAGNTYTENEAIKEMKELLLNKNVHIEVARNNKYLVFFSSDDTYSVNQLIIAKGFASIDQNINANNKMDFLLSEKNAKDNNIGIWNISFKSASSNSSEIDLPFEINIILSIFILINITILVFSIKKLSSLPSWMAIFYGLFSLIMLPLPAILVSFEYDLGAKIYLLFIFVIIIFVFCQLAAFIIKHKKSLNIKKLITLIVGAILIVITYFAYVYTVFDNPRSIHVLEQGFSRSHIVSDTSVFTGDYIYIDGNTDSFNFIDDYIYFSGTTFFGGSYGDVIPKGSIRYIVLIEMLTGFLLQLIFFGMIINIIYEKFNNRLQNTSEKEVIKSKVKDLKQGRNSPKISKILDINRILTRKKRNNIISFLSLLIILLGLFFIKKSTKK